MFFMFYLFYMDKNPLRGVSPKDSYMFPHFSTAKLPLVILQC